MNRRLRKKKRKGEFRELGFSVVFRLGPGLSDEELDRVCHEWILRAIEGNGLAFGGGSSRDGYDVFVTARGPRCSATDEHRERVAHWLESNSLVIEYAVFSLVDAWHGYSSGRSPLPKRAQTLTGPRPRTSFGHILADRFSGAD
jgi:hypothetical protein